MSLREKLEAESALSAPGPRCAVGLALGAIPEADLAEIHECLAARKTITNGVLQEHFEATYKVYLSAQQFSRHRRGLCRCR